MAEGLFDLESLAEYLHLSVAQVQRLIDRGGLPATRVGGQWRFVADDVNRWLEQRIGLADASGLDEVEGWLHQTREGDPERRARIDAWNLTELMPLEAVQFPLSGRTRSSIIDEMCEVAARTGWLWDPRQMGDLVRERESMQSTALDNGAALLHPRRPQPGILGEAFVAVGVSQSGIPFGADRGVLTDVFFLLLSLDDRGHLQALARLSRLVAAPGFLDSLRAADSSVGLRDALIEGERRLVEAV